MASLDTSKKCSRCFQIFSQKSSLVRHRKRCLRNIKTPSRQKACRQCAHTKSKCDLQRPHCGRCQTRSLECRFQLDDGTCLQSKEQAPEPAQPRASFRRTSQDDSRETITTSPYGASLSESRSLPSSTILPEQNQPSPASRVHPHERIAPELVIERLRNQARLGNSTGTASTGPAARHIMSFVIRVLQSWPRMMAGPVVARFPPIIHHLQIAQGLPLPLAQCSTLLKTWIACEESGRALVHDLIKLEVTRLLQQYQSYTGTNLLAATQSLLILAIILLFGSNKTPAVSPSEGAQILVEMWDVKHRLANTGMFLKEEIDHVLPTWEDWAIVSAKRRTILALHHIEWVWSLLQGYPILTCFELAPLPAPSAGYLWSDIDEASWNRQYVDWLAQWKDGGYKMGELFNIKHRESLDARSEMWLAEVDEFGMLLMSEINAVSCVE